jgi:hypothetical protein
MPSRGPQLNYFPSFQTLLAIKHADSLAKFVSASRQATLWSLWSTELWNWSKKLKSSLYYYCIMFMNFRHFVWHCYAVLQFILYAASSSALSKRKHKLACLFPGVMYSATSAKFSLAQRRSKMMSAWVCMRAISPHILRLVRSLNDAFFSG